MNYSTRGHSWNDLNFNVKNPNIFLRTSGGHSKLPRGCLQPSLGTAALRKCMNFIPPTTIGETQALRLCVVEQTQGTLQDRLFEQKADRTALVTATVGHCGWKCGWIPASLNQRILLQILAADASHRCHAYPPNQLALSLHDLPCAATLVQAHAARLICLFEHGHAGVMAYGTPLRFSGQARNGRAQQSRETCCVCDNCCVGSGWWRSTVCEFKPKAFVSFIYFWLCVSFSLHLPFPPLAFACNLTSACYAHWSSKACTSHIKVARCCLIF